MHRFLVVIEQGEENYSAYSPDLPGCVATGQTLGEAEQQMVEAIQLHIQGLRQDGLPIPTSHAHSEFVAVSVP